MFLLDNVVRLLSMLAPTTVSTDTDTTSIDLSQYEGSVLIAVSVATGGTGTLTPTVEDSADNSTFAAIPADALFDPDTGADAAFAAVTTTASFQVLAVKRDRCRRHLRVHLDAGTSHVVAVSAAAARKYGS